MRSNTVVIRRDQPIQNQVNTSFFITKTPSYEHIERQASAAASHLLHWINGDVGNESGTHFEASGERHHVLQWIQSDAHTDTDTAAAA